MSDTNETKQAPAVEAGARDEPPQHLKTLDDAIRCVAEAADGIKAGCACGDEWPDVEDKRYYDAQVDCLTRLRSIRAALARASEAAAGEPVAWMRTYRQFGDTQSEAPDPGYLVTSFHQNADFAAKFPGENIPLYATPQPASDQQAASDNLRDLISDDAYAMSFQTLGQYRSALLKALAAKGDAWNRRIASAAPAEGRDQFEKGLPIEDCFRTPDGKYLNTEIQSKWESTAQNDRATWTCEQWAKHVGAWENTDRHVCFGSWQALNAMLIQFSLAVATAPTLSAAVRDVLAERRRVVEQEGFTPEHDDEHDACEMAEAAAAYALHYSGWSEGGIPLEVWPADWSRKWWKPTTPRRNLVKATELLIAEIERIDRARATEGS